MRRPSRRRRVTSVLAIVLGAVTAADVVITVTENLSAGVAALVGLGVALAFAWQGLLRHGVACALWFAAAGAAVAVVLAVLATAGLLRDLGVVCVGALGTAAAVRIAFGSRGSAGGAWQSAERPRRPVLLINPRSGGGKAGRASLADHARTQGINTVLLAPGDDLEALARGAVACGADALGMAGGDGSLAVVAAIASENGLPFICVPAGTRNHFALDLGVNRSDLVGALDAFTAGVERRVDLAEVNGRAFLNNVSLGVYAEAIRQPGYRGAKLRTLFGSVRGVLGPSARLPEMSFRDDRGCEHSDAAVVLVSNNPYAIDRVVGRGSRPGLDSGRLGVISLARPGEENRAWSPRTFTVDGDASVTAGLDGEAVTLEPPLRCVSRPGALRVRISPRHPGVSPSARLPHRPRVVVPRLARIAAGRS